MIFLSVTGVFHIRISCDLTGVDAEKWTAFVFNLLIRALSERGIGGKTNAGYGRMDPIHAPLVTENQSTIHKPGEKRYQVGDKAQVTREKDPYVRKNRPYFKADDGFSGPLQGASLSDDELNKITNLQIKESHPGGGYSFILP